MGLLGNLLNKAGGAAPDRDTLTGIFDLLNSKNIGGLEGLAGKLTGSGLGDVINSWISTGKNKSISTGQINNALGSDVVSQLAAKLGISPGAAAGKLSKYLPQVIDKLTPDGKMPSSGKLDVQDIIGALLKKK